MDRFKSPKIDSEKYLFEVMRYIELNPCRAKMVTDPKEFRWSSFNYYAYGQKDPLLTPAPCYLWLGNTDEERQIKYRELVYELLITEGVKKKNYSVVHFIGNPQWVIENNSRLREIIKEKKRLKLEKQTNQQPPPE